MSILVAVSVCVVTLLALGASSASAYKLGLLRGGPEIWAKAPDGYAISLEKSSPHTVDISVSRGLGLFKNVYTAPARFEGRSTVVRLGQFGRIRLEFRPMGKPEAFSPFDDCTGRPIVFHEGVFVGTFRFRGEHGRVQLTRSRLPGSLTRTHVWNCNGDQNDGVRRPPERLNGGADLAAECGPVFFRALGGRRRSAPKPIFPDEEGFTFYIASKLEKRGGVTVKRRAAAFGSEGGFLNDGIYGATVRPPEPFSGTGTLTVDPDGTRRWTGDLRVKFMGGSAALAGRGFQVGINRYKLDGPEPELSPASGRCARG
jgi:hypothetical protein